MLSNDIHLFNPTNAPDTSNWDSTTEPQKSSLLSEVRRASRRQDIMRPSLLMVKEDNGDEDNVQNEDNVHDEDNGTKPLE